MIVQLLMHQPLCFVIIIINGKRGDQPTNCQRSFTARAHGCKSLRPETANDAIYGAQKVS